MNAADSGRLVGSQIHGFHTLQDLDVPNIFAEARMRWLRPNEIHAILSNYNYFSIIVKPLSLPKSGRIVLFDRKKLRNFRKDGHNWKKKKDGKTVKEAHEHLKIGNDERIHVYYAHGQDSSTFVRRCYWLLDKSLEHIVFVHYRDTQELQGSPATPGHSVSSSNFDQSTPQLVADHTDSGVEPSGHLMVRNHEMRIDEIDTLEWDELLAINNLLVTDDPIIPTSPKADNISFFDQHQIAVCDSGRNFPAYSPEVPFGDLTPQIDHSNNNFNLGTMENQVNSHSQNSAPSIMGRFESLDVLANEGLQKQDSFGQWMNSIISDSPGLVDNPSPQSLISTAQDFLSYSEIGDLDSSLPEQIFSITDVSPAWGYSTEKTKVLVTGYVNEGYLQLGKSNLLCVCGDICVPAEIIQVGVYRCFLPPQSPGLVNLYLSTDGHKPISQVLNFEYRAMMPHEQVTISNDQSEWEEFQLQMRLAYLLFSSSRSLNVLTSKVSAKALKEAQKFANKTSNFSNSWVHLMRSIQENRTSYPQAKDCLFELTLKNKLKEWLLERIVEGSKTTEYDAQGQGVIHLCAVLGYTWAIYLFSWSGLSLDFRDKYGWTALHWAAYCGREKMVAVLLSAGANPSLVTDPTKANPGGCTAADLASMKDHDGLAAYLSEKALVSHFNKMKIAGNISGSLSTSTSDTVKSDNLNEEELYLKDTLAAYRTAAEAAARIQAAFREHAFKVQTKTVQYLSPEDEARNIVAAMKIQHAFRNFERRKKMAAATRIQYRFRTWKIRKDFLNLRRQTIKIQAVFRGFQVRKQYRKIIWSVGVLEKAVLRWRLKRKGFRGLSVDPVGAVVDENHGSDIAEDFYRSSQKQAEERVEKSVVRVQAMFRSKKAQQEYRRMKLAYDQAKLEYDSLLHPDTDIEK